LTESEIVLEQITKIIEKFGFVTEDQILELSSKYELSLTELDAISDIIISKGIVVLNEGEEEEDFDEETFDASQVDYNLIYDEIVSLQPSLSNLIADIKKIKPPQRREFSNLIMHAQEGNEFARTRIIHMYLRTALKQALFFSKRFKTNLEETIQEAFAGLVVAFNQYDMKQNSAFISYAALWMMQVMQREIPPHDTLVYCPMHIKEHYFKLFRFLEKEGESEYGLEDFENRKVELSKILNIDEDKLDYIRLIIQPVEEYGISHEEELSAKELHNQNFMIEDAIHQAELRDMLRKLSSSFPEREKEILALRFGFIKDKIHTLQEIADIYNISRERIRQLESKVLRRFKHPKRMRILKDFL